MPFQSTKRNQWEQVRLLSHSVFEFMLYQKWVLISMNWIEKFKGNSFHAPSLSHTPFTRSLEFSQHIKYFKCLYIYWKLFAPNQKNEQKQRHSALNNTHSFCDAGSFSSYEKGEEKFFIWKYVCRYERAKKLLFKVLNEMEKKEKWKWEFEENEIKGWGTMARGQAQSSILNVGFSRWLLLQPAS